MKGNWIVGQSGGCTAVLNCSLLGVVREAMDRDPTGAIYGARHGIEGILAQDFVDMRTLGRETLWGLRETPAAALGSCRRKLAPDEEAQVVNIFKEHNIRFFCYIGGNDSADTTQRIARRARSMGYELFAIAVPKTIDNDLPFTDHCPGYGSAARFIAQSTQEAGRDTEAMRRQDPVKIIEVMGRNAGWLAAASALGKRDDVDPPHLVCVPEHAFRVDAFVADVGSTVERFGYAVVVISETVRDASGKRVGRPKRVVGRDPFGHPYIEGAASLLVEALEDRLKIRARFDKPGTIQRMAMPYVSSVDQDEAEAVGRRAAQLAFEGRSEVMVTLERVSQAPYGCHTGTVPIEKIANVEKLLPPEFYDPDEHLPTQAFHDYALPLIGEPLPTHVRLA